MIVTEIFIYPIKSCQGISLQQAEVTPKGFAWDREFMLVDHHGKFISQRQYPQLATVQVQLSPNQIIISQSINNRKPLEFQPTLTGREISVQVWRDHTIAIDQGDEIANWFNQLLELTADKTCRLVRQSPQHQRPVDSRYGVKPEDKVSFADGYPYLLTASASLVELNRRIKEFPGAIPEVDMIRFRPNIVIKTEAPFVEGDWQSIQIGEIEFVLVKPCSRCIITTVNQTTGVKDESREPLRTLSSFRQFSEEGVFFGENMIARDLGTIKVGDEIRVLARKEKSESPLY